MLTRRVGASGSAWRMPLLNGAIAAAVLCQAPACSPARRSVEEVAPPRFDVLPEGIPGLGSDWSVVGRSVEGRAIQARVIGPTKPLADIGARRCLIIAGIHGDEPEGLTAVDEVARVARSHAARWTTAIIRDLNPDGTAHRTRRNAQGVDLNRNWPASSFRSHRSHGAHPLSEPESMVGNRLIELVQPELIVVFHSSSTGPFVTFDGPARSLAPTCS